MIKNVTIVLISITSLNSYVKCFVHIKLFENEDKNMSITNNFSKFLIAVLHRTAILGRQIFLIFDIFIRSCNCFSSADELLVKRISVVCLYI